MSPVGQKEKKKNFKNSNFIFENIKKNFFKNFLLKFLFFFPRATPGTSASIYYEESGENIYPKNYAKLYKVDMQKLFSIQASIKYLHK